ncbi:hypothetical protein ABNX05_08480 [Lysinibacillus sp. M3]|uniref:Uncharacterized protein n=1 Tax=Lysinibacillus zambalensis TaxID=3160866 RepID=A0ABV1MTR9_9BACI
MTSFFSGGTFTKLNLNIFQGVEIDENNYTLKASIRKLIATNIFMMKPRFWLIGDAMTAEVMYRKRTNIKISNQVLSADGGLIDQHLRKLSHI